MAEKNVRIRLFKDNSRYKGDLFVSVNGVNYKIRRGVPLHERRCVYEHHVCGRVPRLRRDAGSVRGRERGK